MTRDERVELAKNLKATYKVYGRDLDTDAAQLMVDDLNEFPFPKLMDALFMYRRDKKNKFPPNIADVISIIDPQVDDQARAVEIASLVVNAVSKYGWSNAEDAKNYIGDIGWEAVKRYGGWMYVCENLGSNIDLTTFSAQVREIAKARIQIGRAGLSHEQITGYNKPQLESNPKGLESAADVLKSIMPPTNKE